MNNMDKDFMANTKNYTLDDLEPLQQFRFLLDPIQIAKLSKWVKMVLKSPTSGGGLSSMDSSPLCGAKDAGLQPPTTAASEKMAAKDAGRATTRANILKFLGAA